MKAIGKWRTMWLALLLWMVVAGGTAWGQEAVAAPDLTAGMSDLRVGLDTVWVLIAAMLVFFMNTGFAMVESGLAVWENAGEPSERLRTANDLLRTLGARIAA